MRTWFFADSSPLNLVSRNVSSLNKSTRQQGGENLRVLLPKEETLMSV